jgi:hypothetical protein
VVSRATTSEEKTADGNKKWEGLCHSMIFVSAVDLFLTIALTEAGRVIFKMKAGRDTSVQCGAVVRQHVQALAFRKRENRNLENDKRATRNACS